MADQASRLELVGPNLDLDEHHMAQIRAKIRHELVVQFQTLKLQVELNEYVGDHEFARGLRLNMSKIERMVLKLDGKGSPAPVGH